MDESGRGPDDLGKVGKESDHIVTGLPLDFIDAIKVEFHVSGLPDRLGSGFRNGADRRLRVTSVGFDLEPDAEARLGRPDRRHLWTRVAGDHGEIFGFS